MKNSTTARSGELKEMVSLIKNVFGDICADASISEALLDVDIQDAFSKRISDMIDKPLSSSFEALQGIENAIKEMLNTSIEEFLTSNKEVIKSAYRLKHSESILHYSIVFKDDDVNKRAVLYSFISDYKNSKLSARFPIIFQGIPLSLESDFMREVAEKEKFVPVIE